MYLLIQGFLDSDADIFQHLHSIMYLLIQHSKQKMQMILMYLHSIMYLLIQKKGMTEAQIKEIYIP